MSAYGGAMNRMIPVLLAALLVSSLLAMPVIATDPGAAGERETPSASLQQASLQYHEESPTEIDGTTNRLQLHGEVRSERTTYGTDPSVALASMDDQLRTDRDQYTLIDREFAAASPDERKNMVSAAYDRITERTDALKEREREAVRAHANGTVSDRELIQTLVRNYNEATLLYDALDQLRTERTDQIEGYDLLRPVVRADLTTLELYRMSLQTSLAVASQSPDDREIDLLIETSRDGYSLSTLDGDTYVVETVRFDNRDADAENQFENLTTSEMVEEATAYYPWAEEHGSPSFRDSGANNLYYTVFDIDHSQLQMYLDGGTGEVYRESQELSLDSLPEADTETWSNDDLDLAVTRTPAHGPAKVTVTEAGSDEPVSATVSIGETEVGTTDTNGTLWILPPSSGYELTVESTDGTISGTVTDD